MKDSRLFLPEAITEAMAVDLPAALRVLAESIESGEIDGRLSGQSPFAGGRYDDRMHILLLLDIAAPIMKPLPASEPLALETTQEPRLCVNDSQMDRLLRKYTAIMERSSKKVDR